MTLKASFLEYIFYHFFNKKTKSVQYVQILYKEKKRKQKPQNITTTNKQKVVLTRPTSGKLCKSSYMHIQTTVT